MRVCAGRAELRNLIPCWVTEHGFGAVTERLLPQSNVSQRSSNMRSSQELYDIPIYTYLCYPIDLVISPLNSQDVSERFTSTEQGARQQAVTSGAGETRGALGCGKQGGNGYFQRKCTTNVLSNS